MEKYGDVELDFSKMEGVKKKLNKVLRHALISISAEIAEQTSEEITINNQVDTGAMRASIFLDLIGDGSMTRSAALSSAKIKAALPGAKSGRPHDFHEAVSTWDPRGAYEAKVALSAEYAKYQEKRMPFLLTAFDIVKARVPFIVAESIILFSDNSSF